MNFYSPFIFGGMGWVCKKYLIVFFFRGDNDSRDLKHMNNQHCVFCYRSSMIASVTFKNKFMWSPNTSCMQNVLYIVNNCFIVAIVHE